MEAFSASAHKQVNGTHHPAGGRYGCAPVTKPTQQRKPAQKVRAPVPKDPMVCAPGCMCDLLQIENDRLIGEIKDMASECNRARSHLNRLAASQRDVQMEDVDKLRADSARINAENLGLREQLDTCRSSKERLLKQSNQQQAQIDKLLQSTDKDTKISTLQREVDKLTNSIGSCNRALDTCRSEKQRQEDISSAEKDRIEKEMNQVARQYADMKEELEKSAGLRQEVAGLKREVATWTDKYETEHRMNAAHTQEALSVKKQLELHDAKAAADAQAAAEIKAQLATAHYELATSRDELTAAKKRIRKLEPELDRLKEELQNQARSSASAGAAQYALEDQITEMREQSSRDAAELDNFRKEAASQKKQIEELQNQLTEMRKQSSRDAEVLDSLRKEIASQKKEIEELQNQHSNSGSSDAQRLHALENELSDTKHRMSEAAKDFKFRELKTDEEIEQLKKSIHQLEEEKASNAPLLEAGFRLGREAKILQPKALGVEALLEEQHTGIKVLSNPKSAGSLPNKIKVIKHRNDDIQKIVGSLTHVIDLCRPFMPEGEMFELSMAFCKRLFDDLDEDETEMVPRLDLRTRIDNFLAENAAIQGLSDTIRAMDAMIVERDEFLEICEEWLAKHK